MKKVYLTSFILILFGVYLLDYFSAKINLNNNPRAKVYAKN